MPGGSAGPVRGFTLLEVLVALAILAIALAAVIRVGTTNSANAIHLRDKTFAHWVANDRVTELHLSGEWPSPGERRGRVEMAGREWSWLIRVSNTQDDRVRRLDVHTGLGDGEPLAQVVAFVPRSAGRPGGGQ